MFLTYHLQSPTSLKVTTSSRVLNPQLRKRLMTVHTHRETTRDPSPLFLYVLSRKSFNESDRPRTHKGRCKVVGWRLRSISTPPVKGTYDCRRVEFSDGTKWTEKTESRKRFRYPRESRVFVRIGSLNLYPPFTWGLLSPRRRFYWMSIPTIRPRPITVLRSLRGVHLRGIPSNSQECRTVDRRRSHSLGSVVLFWTLREILTRSP